VPEKLVALSKKSTAVERELAPIVVHMSTADRDTVEDGFELWTK
jgi:hypothetical protein